MRKGAAGAAMTAAYWDEAGAAWAELQALLDRLYAPIGEAIEAAAFPGPGGRVLDVGCGAGATTLAMARRLSPAGRCVGVDVSSALLDLARARARAGGLEPQVDFVLADAQTHDFGEASFDAVMSRFGVMFFEDSVAAFANLRRSVRTGGGLVFACWRGPADNPLSQIPVQAAYPYLGEIPRPARDAPGRFAFADADRVRRILKDSGWRDVEITPLDIPTPVTFEELMTLSLRLGPLGSLLPKQTDAVRRQVHDAVAAALERYVENGSIPMRAACWLVAARA
ncbi:class I SAM-dependent methyltransferase [Caulobacter sp. 17J80-11]|uniref:class I SAM-dependent methyltransferase n=1 Tax=Caulobacter sp. 17J80-11 TaxID=2763502 RepID=UPI001653B874|nr:class I SAM-dependent methyltransferase [Caulobacter sp. 17J80-11]MBC6982766.1 methyltransferase domain-containing protein [Caulobacter sp. 17J80-11]